jgi:hypothetical protein
MRGKVSLSVAGNTWDISGRKYDTGEMWGSIDVGV